MSIYQAFKRVPVDGQLAQRLSASVIPSATRGLTLSENEAFMQPGGALVLDNWRPTMRGMALRGGSIRWCVLPETTAVISALRDSISSGEMFAASCAAASKSPSSE